MCSHVKLSPPTLTPPHTLAPSPYACHSYRSLVCVYTVSGSAIPAVQYGLKCAPNLQWFYWSCAWGNVVLGIPMSFWPLLRDYRVVRIVYAP